MWVIVIPVDGRIHLSVQKFAVKALENDVDYLEGEADGPLTPGELYVVYHEFNQNKS